VTTGSKDARVLAPPRTHPVSIWPATIVLAVALGTLGIFTVINLLDSNPTATPAAPVILGGLPVGSRAVFTGFVAGGGPPPDVASALLAPTTTSAIGAVATGGGAVGNYDEAIRLRVVAPRAQLLGFYRSHLEALGWSLFSTRIGGHGDAELLFQKAGSDSWYWELGVIASPTHAGATAYTYRLFQASDIT
jgi:hypothetical protein